MDDKLIELAKDAHSILEKINAANEEILTRKYCQKHSLEYSQEQQYFKSFGLKEAFISVALKNGFDEGEAIAALTLLDD